MAAAGRDTADPAPPDMDTPAAGKRAGADAKLRIYISYSRDDLDFADQLFAALEAYGFAPDMDRQSSLSAEDWQTRLGSLIGEVDTVVFVLPPSSALSKVCAWELAEADRLAKRVIPVICRPLDGSIPPSRLRDLGSILFYPQPGVPGSGFGSGLGRLVQILNADIDWLRAHTWLARRSAHWDTGGRPAGRLLSGGDLAEARAWIAQRPKDVPQPSPLQLDFIRASEREEAARIHAERQEVEAIAAAQAEQAAALEAAEGAAGRRKRLRATLLAALTVAVVVTGWRAFQAFQESAQREAARQEAVLAQRKAEAETNRIDAALSQTEQEKQRAEARLDEVYLAQSRVLAARAREAVEAQDYTKAVLLALEALPEPGVEPRRPLYPAATSVLHDALRGLRERSVLVRHSGPVLSAACSVDGKRVVTASADGRGRLWEAADGKETSLLKGHAGPVRSAAFSPDARAVVTASADGTARLWDAAAGGREIAVLQGHAGPVLVATFNPDGTRIATASEDGTARLWDAADGKEVGALKGHTGAVRSVAFSADGTRGVTASEDSTARVWDAAGGKPLAVLKGHARRLLGAAFSPDGRRVVTASDDATARVWDAGNGKEMTVLKGHGGPVWNAAFSPDGRAVVTASVGGMARIWDAANGKEVTALTGHASAIRSAAFSPDGRRVLTASEDKTARVWEAADGKVVAVLRSEEHTS